MTHETRQFNFANNARSTLATGLASSATQLSVQPGHGARFPVIDPTYDEIFACLLFSGDLSSYEIVYVTGKGGDIFTIERAKEGTVALDFPSGAVIVHNATAAFFSQLAEFGPVPVITSLSPDTAVEDSGGFTLTINGFDFLPDITGTFNGVSRVVTYISPTQVTMAVQAADISNFGYFDVVVSNPPPAGGGDSAAAVFYVPFSPLDLPSLGGWWDASDIATISVATPPVDDGETVTGWNDKSGNGNHLNAGSTTGYQLAQVNGLGVVGSSGGAQHLRRSVASGITGMGGPNFSVFVVAVLDFNLLAFAGLMGRTDPGWGTGWRISNVSGTGASIEASVNGYTTAPITVSAGDTGVDHPHIFAMTWDEAENRLTGYRNGVQTGTNTSYVGVVAHNQDLWLLEVSGGASIFNASGQGFLCEAVYVNDVVSTADRQRIEGYLAHKWGFVDTLDAGHPYKSAPP